jgi:hypothetical protein
MSDDQLNVDRRSLLKYAGVSSGVVFSGLAQPAAANRSGADPSVEPQEFRPDISDMPNVEEALIRINEDATVTKRMRINRSKEQNGPGTYDRSDPEAASYSLNLSPSAVQASSTSIEADKPEAAPLTAELNKQETTVSSERVRTMDSGIPDEPDPGYSDWVAYVHTASQECGPLARTNVTGSSFGSSTFFDDDREMVDGDACDGEKWDEKFEAFCDVLDPIPGLTCQVPDAFNTNWYVKSDASKDNGGSYEAATFFTCPNFPAIPDTAFSAQHIKVEDNGDIIDTSTTTGALNGAAPRDIDLDMNEIVNIFTKGVGSVIGTGTVVYSWALTTYLLQHDAATIR